MIAGLVFALMGVLATERLSAMATAKAAVEPVAITARVVAFDRVVDRTELLSLEVEKLSAAMDVTAAELVVQAGADEFVERVELAGYHVTEAPLACGVLADDLGWLLESDDERRAVIVNGETVTSVAVYPLPTEGLFLYAEQSFSTGGSPEHGLCTARLRDDRPFVPSVGVDPSPL